MRRLRCLVEAKRSDADPSPHLPRFGAQLGCNRLVQVVESAGVRKQTRIGKSLVHVASAEALLAHLPRAPPATPEATSFTIPGAAAG